MHTYSLCLEELQFKIQKKNSNLYRDLEVRGSNPGSGSNFSLEFELNERRELYLVSKRKTSSLIV